jgi:hypothetical protein
MTCGGYSGNGEGYNNPDVQDIPNVGPIPVGEYIIGAPVDKPNTGRYSRPLTPLPSNNMHGRSGFFWHGDNSRGDNSASSGCPISPLSCRSRVPTGERLEVVRGN